MIISIKTEFKIKNPLDIKLFSTNDLNSLIKMDKAKELSFSVPDRFVSDSDKTTYKVGFLVSFFEILYPEKTIGSFYKRINEEYQVFIGDRQMRRRCLMYQKDDKFLN